MEKYLLLMNQVMPPSPNEPMPHTPPRNELQYITDRIPAYVALRELKGDVKSTALQWLLARLEKL